MKNGVLMNTKFLKLKRRLGQPSYQVAGILEMLWQLTGSQAQQGNIGKLSNEDICAFLEWDGDDSELINALIGCGWLDECPKHRLLVHDWHEHCPKYIKGNLVSHGREFITEPVEQPAKQPAKQDGSATSELLPNQTKPNLTNKRDSPSGDGRPPPTRWIMDLWNEQAHSAMPRVRVWTDKRSKAARRMIKKYGDDATDWIAQIERMNKSGFMLGENRRGWCGSLDFLLELSQADAWVKIYEGHYDGSRDTVDNITKYDGKDRIEVI